jgi:hypothetical protein
MLKDYAAANGLEVWNMVRLSAYLKNVGSPFDTGPNICSCDTLTPTNLGATDADGDPVSAYTTPDDPAQPAPWFDADLPVSAEFLGFMPTSVSGTNDNPRTRAVTNAVGGGGVFGPTRVQPRTMTVQGVLIGTSCCGTDYGMQYLSEVLSACAGGACDGDCFEMFDCCPSTVLTQPQLDAAHKRTFRRTALVSGPTEVSRGVSGPCANGACSGGDLVTVEFVLVAATPWAWTDPTPLLSVPFPAAGTGPCLTWCFPNADPNECIVWDTSGEGTCASYVWTTVGGYKCTDTVDVDICPEDDCLHAVCVSPNDACQDPLRPVATPPQPTAPTAPFCVPLAPQSACYTIDLTNRPTWSTDVPIMTISAGADELRNVRITFYEKPTGTSQTCDQIKEANDCFPANDFYITYIPAGGAITIDGQTGRATIDCSGDCRTASTVFSTADGGPLVINNLECAMYCVCLESDPMFPPDPAATFDLSISGQGY